MKNGFPRSLDGRLMDAHEVLNSTASASSSRAIPELYWSTQSFGQCGKDRLQRTTRLLCGTQWWLHDSDSQQNWSGNEKSFREIVG